jgi:hypothetical protein
VRSDQLHLRAASFGELQTHGPPSPFLERCGFRLLHSHERATFRGLDHLSQQRFFSSAQFDHAGRVTDAPLRLNLGINLKFMMSQINQFLSGSVMTAHLIVALFFLRFWRKTADHFFAIFSAAFFMLAMERVPLVLVSSEHEMRPLIYTIRLFAFSLIAFAILYKNRRSRT